jgi:uncharacterized membrane protein
MDVEKHSHTLERVPATRRLVEELYAHGKITHEARDYSLNLLCPKKWGLWTSRLFLTIGIALVLSGIIYFFAFNWAKITPTAKLSSIQFGIVGCLVGVCVYSLQRISGQLLLLSASILVGVFMAVFGQIYQTGADSYQLFMMWSLFTFGWTLLSNFAAGWAVWLFITNMFLVLWWEQAALPTKEMEFMIFTYMTILNGSALALREYLVVDKVWKWLAVRWTRVILTITTLITMLIPVVVLILEPSQATGSIILGSIIGLAGHCLAYFVYRYKLQDMWSLSTIILSGCIIAEFIIFKLLLGEQFWRADAGMYLFMGLMTLGIFTTAVIYLRKTGKSMEGYYV